MLMLRSSGLRTGSGSNCGCDCAGGMVVPAHVIQVLDLQGTVLSLQGLSVESLMVRSVWYEFMVPWRHPQKR